MHVNHFLTIRLTHTNKPKLKETMVLTMHQKRCRRDLVATMFIGECGGLFDGGEMFGGGWCVNMTHLYTRGR